VLVEQNLLNFRPFVVVESRRARRRTSCWPQKVLSLFLLVLEAVDALLTVVLELQISEDHRLFSASQALNQVPLQRSINQRLRQRSLCAG